MKIQDTLTTNKAYWEAQAKMLEARLATYQEEVQKIALELNNAQQQIALYDKAQQFLASADKAEADDVAAIDAQVPINAVAVEAKPEK